VAAPLLAALTDTTKGTGSPNLEGFGAAVSWVVVAALLTTWATADDVLAANDAVPPYDAVTWCVPTDSVEVVKVALPALSSVPVPRVAVPSRKVTVPPGVPVAPPAGPAAAEQASGAVRRGGVGGGAGGAAAGGLTSWGRVFEVLAENGGEPA